MQPRRPQGQRAPPALDDHVADLPGDAAAEPGLAIEHQPAADARCPRRPRRSTCRAGRRRARTPRDRDLDVVAHPHGRAELRRGARPSGKGPPIPAGCAPMRPRRSSSSTSPGEPTPTPIRSPVSTPGGLGGLLDRRRHLAGDVLRGALVGVGRRDSPSTWLESSVTIAWIFVPPRSMPPAGVASRARAGSRRDPVDGAFLRRRDPDPALAGRDRCRLGSHLDRLSDLSAGAWVEACHGAVTTCHPNVSKPGGDVEGLRHPDGVAGRARPVSGSSLWRVPAAPSAQTADSPTVTLKAPGTAAGEPVELAGVGIDSHDLLVRRATHTDPSPAAIEAPLPPSEVGGPRPSAAPGSTRSSERSRHRPDRALARRDLEREFPQLTGSLGAGVGAQRAGRAPVGEGDPGGALTGADVGREPGGLDRDRLVAARG